MKPDLSDLQSRVELFNTLQLPGQGMSMHMGTSYLVNDLWRTVERLEKERFKYETALMLIGENYPGAAALAKAAIAKIEAVS